MQQGNLHLLIRSKVTYQGERSSENKLYYEENVKVASFEKLKSNWNQSWIIDRLKDSLYVRSCGQRSYTKVKGNQGSSCKIGSKWKIHLIWKVDARLELNLGLLIKWRNLHMFLWPQQMDLGQLLICIIHNPRLQVTPAVCDWEVLSNQFILKVHHYM